MADKASLVQEAVKKVQKILKNYTVKAEGSEEQQAGLSPQAETAAQAVVRILTPFKEELTPDIMHKVLSAAGIQLESPGAGEEETESKPGEGGDMGMQKPEGVSDEHHKGAEMEADKAYKSHLAKMGYEKYPAKQPAMKNKAHEEGSTAAGMEDDEEDEDGVMKSAVMKSDGTLDLSKVPAGVRGAVEAIYKGQMEAVKKAQTLEAELNKVIESNKNKELVAKAASFKNLGADTAGLAHLMKGMSADDLTKFEAVMKSADEQIGKGKLFQELGSSQGGRGGDKWAMIEKAAEGYVAKSGDKVSKAEGVDAFLKTEEGRKLYAEYTSERGGI